MRWLPALLGFALSSPAWAAPACTARSGSTRLPLVELYTAEGCNQCPPADRWLGTLASGSKDVAALAFHVDYWNDDGWVDPFSDAAYTQRQDYRVRLARKKALVTPQVMVGANSTVNWREPATVNRVLRAARQGAPEVALSLSGNVIGDHAELQLSARPGVETKPEGEAPMLWLALYQEGADSRITAGENRGVSLHHTNVVRKLAGPWKLEATGTQGTVSIPLKGLDPTGLGVVLFAESGRDARTLQSVVLPLRNCR
ncbi:DUF1223 domain-containing protein [Lysobacter sp. Root494]|uniref:DUF1223 domain-containing protein n=1 Tax=Lysobacter sp. Root494 TaxID=1736549 RepID=UPI0006FD86ED|nr:DUF1223 domain-containing protein [Lysobacter sp. Root494]KQY49264.1 hypothetical protein ASD14_14400 [Lysobacter sp. Root494]